MSDENTKRPENEESPEFKKVLRGYDPQEVNDYIGELTDMMLNASKNYEKRMAEIKQELAFTGRERDSLRDKCAELEAKLAAADAPSSADSAEYTQPRESDDLSEQAAKARELTCAAEKRAEEAEEKLTGLTALLEAKDRELHAYREREENAEKLTAERDRLRISLDELSAEKEKTAYELICAQEENQRLASEVTAACEALTAKEDTITALRTELGRADTEKALLLEKNERYKKELDALRKDAREKAYANAEKLSAEEDAFNREKTALRKQIQLQSYHIELAETAVEELKTQLTQIRAAFDG